MIRRALRRDDVEYPRGRKPAGRSGYTARLWAILVVTALVFTGLAARLFQLQVVEGPAMRQAAERINTRTVSVPATRGRILAADGTPLVTNGSTAMLTIDPTVLADSRDGGRAVLTRVQQLVGGDVEQMLARTRACGTRGAPAAPVCFSGSPVEPIPVLANVDPGLAMTLLERPEDFPGIAVRQVPVRRFPAPAAVNAAQVIGYLGRTDSADLQRDSSLTAEDLIGRSGLELSYDRALRGSPGRTVLAVDARGLPVRTVDSLAPTPGQDLVTHLDLPVQRVAESALSDAVTRLRAAKHPATGATALVLDASSGAVVAMASNPSYDPLIWTGGISAADYQRLTAPGAHDPLLNRAIGQLQPPASTFKAVSLPAAIASGVDTSGKYECSSSVTVGSRVFKNYESAAFGSIDLPTALEVSCDTVFYRWAYARWNAEGGINAASTTPNPFTDTARSFGFGRRTGIDLPGEATGNVPGRQWKAQQWAAMRATTCRRATTGYPEVKDRAQAEYFKQLAIENCRYGYQWQAGDAVNLSIGQGDMLVTPLQLAVAYGAVANGGTLWQPQVVAATRSADGSSTAPVTPRRTGTVTLPASARPVLLDGLRRVVTQPAGTAHAAFATFPSSYPISGKTGTGEVYGKDATAWFASYGPKLPSGKQFVVVVMIEQGGLAATAAVPVARQIWDVLRTRG